MVTNNSKQRLSDRSAGEHSIDWNGEENVSIAVVNAVASVTEQEVTEMEPLSKVVDTDSLNELFEPTDRSPRTVGFVEFEYCGCLVRVSADGQLGVVPPGDW